MRAGSTRSLFQYIADSQLNEVVKFLDSHPRNKPLYNETNTSAAMFSLKVLSGIVKDTEIAFENDQDTDELEERGLVQLEIYRNLVSRGFTLGPHEKVKSELTLDIESRTEMRKIHKIYVKNANLRHLTILISKSKLSHDAIDAERSLFHQKITKAYEELNEVEWVDAMLKIAANAENLNVIFNFIQVSGDNADEERQKRIACVNAEDVYIIADDKKRSEYLGILAQELTHYATELIYRNDSKPYLKDSENEQRFEEIVKFCDSKRSSEALVEDIFSSGCNRDIQHAKLIASVPRLLMRYKGDQQSLERVKSSFPELFEFYEKITMADFNKEHPYMTARRNVKELNELVGMANLLVNSEVSFLPEALNFSLDSNQITVTHSNYPYLTMRLIYQQLRAQHSKEQPDFETSYIFLKLQTLENERILDLVVEAFKNLVSPTVFIDCDDRKPEDIQRFIVTFKSKSMTERLFIFHSIDSFEVESMTNSTIRHSWQQLTLETQNEFLATNVNFQGIPVLLKKLLPSESRALRSIPLKHLLAKTVKVGHELNFPTVENYIRRFFLPPASERIEDTENYSIQLNADTLLADAEKQKRILFSDDPGMGKSTEFKEMAKRIKQMSPLVWVLFVDLKSFVEVFERDGKVTKNFDSSDEVAEYFCEKILRIKGFEAQVFSQLFNENKVVFLLDGFDEISPSFKQFNLKLSNAISTITENQLWVSTRTHLEVELKEALNTDALRLKPLNYEDRLNFMKTMLRAKGFEGDVLEKKFVKIEELLSNLKRNSRLSGAVSNPILLRIITEVFEDEVGDLITQANFYSVYRSFIKRIVENFLKKGYEAINDSSSFLTNSTNIMAFHQKRALEVIFVASSEEVRSSIDVSFEGYEELPVEQILRVSFTVADSSGRLQFIHRTFAEFFVTDFFNRNLFGIDMQRMNAVVTLLKEAFIGQKGNSGMIGSFFEGVIESFELDNDTQRLQRIERIFKDKFSKDEIRSVFHSAVEEGLMHIIRKLPIHSGEEREQFWCDDGGNVLIIAAEYQSVSFLENLLSLAESNLGVTEVDKMLHGFSSSGDTIFTASCRNRNPGILRFFLNHPKVSFKNPRTKEVFTFNSGAGKISDGKNLLMQTLMNHRIEELKSIFETLRLNFEQLEIERVLTARDQRGANIFCYFASLDNKEGMFQVLHSFMLEKLQKSQLKELSLQTDSTGMSPLMYVACVENPRELQNLWNFLKECINDDDEFRRLLLLESEESATAMNLAMTNKISTNVEFVRDEYEKVLEIEKVQEIHLKEIATSASKVKSSFWISQSKI